MDLVLGDGGRIGERLTDVLCLEVGMAISASPYSPSARYTASRPGSCPFALNTAPAAGVVRNLISAFAAAESFKPTPTPAWKTV